MTEDVIREFPEVAFPPEVMYPAAVQDDSPSQPICKLTVVERVYHRQGNNPPLQIESKFEYPLSVDEACYFRPSCKVGPEWSALDFGWIGRENAGTIVIQNITGRYLAKIPTPEEKAELDAKALIVSVCYSSESRLEFAVIPPKQNLRLNLFPGADYSIRCPAGQAEFNLYAIPK